MNRYAETTFDLNLNDSTDAGDEMSGTTLLVGVPASILVWVIALATLATSPAAVIAAWRWFL